MLVLILVLFINFNRVDLANWVYLLCLPPALMIVWKLWKAPNTALQEGNQDESKT